ncbi:hypothetical protein SAMN05428952_102134 [Nitrosomonas sp. Nm132]|jgi:hypothetical protein|nr:hypothetical protein SAMN05428952_102134 [Nitrosomonas sp. Nm132]
MVRILATALLNSFVPVSTPLPEFAFALQVSVYAANLGKY